MDLEVFIKETLVAISQGVITANEAISTNGGGQAKVFRLASGDDKSLGLGVSFDVAITSNKATSTNAGVGGKLISVISADVSGERQRSNQDISRVHFHVRVNQTVM